MWRLPNFFKVFVPLTTLATFPGGIHQEASNKPPKNEMTHFPHEGDVYWTPKPEDMQRIKDPMEGYPKVVSNPLEWPRAATTMWQEQAKRIMSMREELDKQNENQTITEMTNSVLNQSFAISETIDHTALKPITTQDMILKLCNEAIEYQFATVCVNPVWVEYCSKLLKDSNVKVCTVIGFPLGANSTKTKVFEAIQAVQDGATEIDMVISVGMIKSGNWDFVEKDVTSVVEAVQSPITNENNNEIIVKVILETCFLTEEEIIKSCEICVRSGADFVKTSTGFGTGGATLENVKIMKNTVQKELKKIGKSIDKVKVKASGGVRNYKDALKMIKAGASRIGTSSGVKIASQA